MATIPLEHQIAASPAPASTDAEAAASLEPSIETVEGAKTTAGASDAAPTTTVDAAALLNTTAAAALVPFESVPTVVLPLQTNEELIARDFEEVRCCWTGRTRICPRLVAG
jgi:hypothetical protein